MRKLLLAVGSCLLLTQANAQLALTNFNSGFPAGWSMIKVDNNTPSANLNAVIVAALQTNAWMVRSLSATDSCMLTASMFTTPARADRWLITPSFTVSSPKQVIYWQDVEGISGANDSIQVWVSPTAGTTVASFTTKIYDGPASEYNANLLMGSKGGSLVPYNGQTIRVAFRNNTYNQGTLRIDNVKTMDMTYGRDAGATGIIFPRIVATSSSNQVKLTINNMGAADITSVQVSYKVDAGTPVTQTFNGLSIAPYGVGTLTFTAPINNPAAGSHTITATIMQVNGSADESSSNDQATASFAVATGPTPRNGLIEQFTSSTCVPCANFNVWYDPMLISTNVNNPSVGINVIRAQMYWPTVQPPSVQDQSYNPDAETRRALYGVNAIPHHCVNGIESTIPTSQSNAALFQTELNNSKNAPAYVAISGTYTISGNNLVANVTVTPNFTLTGSPYVLYLAATERQYTNPNATTTQSVYYHALRKMLPNGNGIPLTSFTAGTPQTFTQTYQYSKGNVAQTNYNFWTTPYSGNLIAFIQDPTTHEMLNSVSIPSKWPTEVKDVTGGISDVQLFPNPATEGARLVFNLEKAGNINVTAVDAMGKVVYNVSELIGNGEHNLYINTANFAAGVYNVVIKTDAGSRTERLTVIK